MVLPPKNFKDEEYFIPKEIFESMDINVSTTSILNEATSVSGRKQMIDVSIDKVTTDYDAIIFVGGPGAIVYFDNEKILNLAKEFFNQKKIVAAICLAPSILANAKILYGRRATAFPSEESNLIKKGAIYTGNIVTVDGNIITGKGPGAAREFASQILKVLGR